MRLDNMILVVDAGMQCPTGHTLTMDTSRQHMTGGRMATTVQPTHVRIPPQKGVPTQSSHAKPNLTCGPLGPDEVDVEKDNALNMAVRYQGQNNNSHNHHNHNHTQTQNHHHQNHHHSHQRRTSSRLDKRSSTEHRRPESKRPGHGANASGNSKSVSQGMDNKRSSLPASLALATSKGLPLVFKNTNLMQEACSTRPLLLYSHDSELQTWTLTPLVGLVLPDQLSAVKPKSSCSSPSSSSSSEEVIEPPAPRALVGEESMPPVPPRGNNCYENIPVPGIIPISRKANSPTPGSQTVEQSNPGLVSKEPISLYSRLSGFDCEKDKEKICRAIDRLNASGFYYESISALEAKAKLRDAQVGTFLIRVSSQLSHLFALSVKTSRGTTSIRLAYENGNFRLDADPQSASKMPAFNCIIALIEYYVLQSTSDARNKCVFLESNGRRDTPVILTRPLREKPQSLKHLCRRSLHYNYAPDVLGRLLHAAPTPCSVQLIDYIKSYPYAL